MKNLLEIEKRKLSYSIGDEPFSREDMIAHLEEFAELYQDRPIHNNHGGQEAAQLFYSWFVAKQLKPRFIIESGVFKGQGTWAFEHASPTSNIICLDPYPQYEQGYKSNKAKYVHVDFNSIDWSPLDKEDTLCFFDDHQDAVQRLVSAAHWGFKKIMFEDNYPPGQGDCISIKKVFESDDPIYVLPRLKAKDYVPSIIKTYYEMPPIYDLETTRWGDSWSSYRMNSPLHTTTDQSYSDVYLEGMSQFTWINYLELNI